ncbi:AMP-binding protein, partial [Klebsiella pneumoniae]
MYSSNRGVQVEHRGVGQRLSWLQKTFALCESDTVLHQAPLAQNTAVWEIFWPLVVGGRLLIADANSQDDPTYLQQLIDRQKVSV